MIVILVLLLVCCVVVCWLPVCYDCLVLVEWTVVCWALKKKHHFISDRKCDELILHVSLSLFVVVGGIVVTLTCLAGLLC